MKISIVIPVFNEEGNIQPLYKKIKSVLGRSNNYEIIFIDDGSTDKSFRILKTIRNKDKKVKIIKFRTNFGQTAAIVAGIDHSKGEVIITMDADLQNDPADIPELLKKIEEGYDVVSGWRYNRKDTFSKRFFSKISNWLAIKLTNVNIHDFGCTLKAYKRDALEDVILYGEMHRYIPALVAWKGYSVTEIKVKHHERKRGKTKYSRSRLFKGLLDLMNISFTTKYSNKPIYFFGFWGLILSAIGFVIGLYMIFSKIVYAAEIADRPLLLLSILLVILGIQFITFGFLSGMIVNLKYEASNKRIYKIKEKLI